MCSSTGSERLSGFGKNAQNQVDEALRLRPDRVENAANRDVRDPFNREHSLEHLDVRFQTEVQSRSKLRVPSAMYCTANAASSTPSTREITFTPVLPIT
jgi:hypothetical protein